MSDSISRKAVLNTLDTMDKALDENRTIEAYKELLKECYKALPPVTPTAKESLVVGDAVSREFQELIVEYPPAELCTYPEYRGKPYFSIKYKENGQEFVGYGTYNPDVMSRYLRDYFIKPPVTPKQRWIPVSERLPEESGSYLTTTRNNAVRVNHFYAGHGHQVFGYRNNVTAWMPLPEPYKDESDIKSRKECPYKPCINYEDGCEEWAGCPCVHYKAESEDKT